MIRFSILGTIMVSSEEIWSSKLIFVVYLGPKQFWGISKFYETTEIMSARNSYNRSTSNVCHFPPR